MDGAGWSDSRDRDDQDQPRFDVYRWVARTGGSARFENYSTPLGCWKDFYAFALAEGTIAVFFRDITDQKRAKSAPRESAARFRLMADAVPQIGWITDTEVRAEFFDKQCSDYAGTSYHATTIAEGTIVGGDCGANQLGRSGKIGAGDFPHSHWYIYVGAWHRENT